MTTEGTAGGRWRLLFLLFFASGISGLLYESIWSRYIKQLVGSAATAQILVLCLFMGGMSVGALLSGRLLRRTKAPVLAYGVIEGLIGLYALAFPYLFAFASRLAYDVIFPALGAGTAITAAKWGVAAGLILPPCVLLGMTFPLMSVGILRRERKRSGEVLAVLYFVNSFGAALGALLSGFALVPWVGLPGTLMVGAGLNLLIMVVAVRDRTPAPPVEACVPSGSEAAGRSMVLLYLAVAFGTGLSSFLYEVGWIRLLSMILGSATHSFEVMLSAFVFGLALGGFWVRKRLDKFKRPELTLAVVQMIMGVAAVATLPCYLLAVGAMGGLMNPENFERTEELWYAFNILRYLLCLLIMLPATFCAGMTLPLLTHVMLRRGQSERSVGQVYGINTLGAIAGASLGGLVLMPLISLKGLVIVGAVVDMGLGIALLQSEIRARQGGQLSTKLRNRCAASAVLIVVFGLRFQLDPTVLTSTVFRRGRTAVRAQDKILYYVDGRTATVAVVDTGPSRMIYTNGKADATVKLDRWPEGRDKSLGPALAGDEPNQFLVGLIPMMLRPEATQGALIGFGSGITCHMLLSSPNLERLDTVEIEPEMVEGSRLFYPANQRAYDDPRSNIIFNDAKAYFASAGTHYDFIISEPTNPWVSGVSSLFTVEFYREVKRYLKPQGILAQWIQGYELSDELLISVLAALDQEFNDYVIYRIGAADWVIISSADGLIPRLDKRVFEWPEAAQGLALLGVHDVAQLDGLMVANRAVLRPFLSDRQPNRDSHPLLDTGAEHARFVFSRAEFLHEWRWTPAPLLEVFGGVVSRPYPAAGIGDLRDPHVMRAAEQAVFLMRLYEQPKAKAPTRISGSMMRFWHTVTRELNAGEVVNWERWFSATFEVYAEVAPFLDVRATPWWSEVVRTATGAEVPARTSDAIELLDALAARDAERLWPLVQHGLRFEPELDRTSNTMVSFPIPQGMLTIAGAVALELRDAPITERREFAAEFMGEITAGRPSSLLAYEVIVDYLLRPQ